MLTWAGTKAHDRLDSFTRRYYEKELGAGIGPSPSLKEHFGYTEPFRRFVQNETFSPQANEIPNTAASWLPGDDYYTNFHEGIPSSRSPKAMPACPAPAMRRSIRNSKEVTPKIIPTSTRWPSWPTWLPICGNRPGVFILPDTKNLARARQARAPTR